MIHSDLVKVKQMKIDDSYIYVAGPVKMDQMGT